MDTCSVCGNSLFWWRSRTGYRVCMRCGRDPFEALEVLARRGRPGLVKQVQGWWSTLPALADQAMSRTRSR
jgi:hypothetical protein